MKFDRWQYDVEKNKFTNRPVIAVTRTIQDDEWARALQEAAIETFWRRVNALDEILKRIEGEE
jgi:hypothetical protein